MPHGPGLRASASTLWCWISIFGKVAVLACSERFPIPERPVVVVLTNYNVPEYRDAALKLGAEHFMDKVRHYERLPEVLNELVGKARSRA
jgi:hypothetical protein